MAITIEEITRIISLQLGVHQVRENDRILEDLGAESADIINILAAIESKFQVFIDEMDIAKIRTVKDLYQRIVDLQKT